MWLGEGLIWNLMESFGVLVNVICVFCRYKMLSDFVIGGLVELCLLELLIEIYFYMGGGGICVVGVDCNVG